MIRVSQNPVTYISDYQDISKSIKVPSYLLKITKVSGILTLVILAFSVFSISLVQAKPVQYMAD